MTSSGRWAFFSWVFGGGSCLRAIEESGFHEIEVAVGAANEHADAVRFRVAVNQIGTALVHSKHRLFQCHGLAALMMIDAVNTASGFGLAFRLHRRRRFHLRLGSL